MKDIKGFLSKKEAEKLQELFLNVHHLGSVLEIGTYCGKSALNFASVAEKVNGLVYTIDHHTGSEEHQLGEEYHDKDLFFEIKNQIKKSKSQDESFAIFASFGAIGASMFQANQATTAITHNFIIFNNFKNI